MGIAEQLTEIYEKEEWWHKARMSHEQAIRYHDSEYSKGNIYVYKEDGEVLGYYQRAFNDDKCFLMNVWVKRKGIFKKLYRHFFDTMPDNIKKVYGEKQSIGGKYIERIITRGRYGKHEDF